MTDREHRLTALEWRLYIVAVLATIYVVTWRVLDRPPAPANAPDALDPIAEPTRAAEPITSEPVATGAPVIQPARAVTPSTRRNRREPPAAPMPAERPRARTVWLHELPPERRPAITPPAGWVVARAEATSPLAPAQRAAPGRGATPPLAPGSWDAASPRATQLAPAPRVIRVPARRRVRTRSS